MEIERTQRGREGVGRAEQPDVKAIWALNIRRVWGGMVAGHYDRGAKGGQRSAIERSAPSLSAMG